MAHKLSSAKAKHNNGYNIISLSGQMTGGFIYVKKHHNYTSIGKGCDNCNWQVDKGRYLCFCGGSHAYLTATFIMM